jgi:hypothetical protein
MLAVVGGPLLSGGKGEGMRRRRVCLAVGLAVLLTAGAALAVGLHRRFFPPGLPLPADDEVVEMRASLRPSRAGKAVPQFVVPDDHVPLILEWLRPGERVRGPGPLGPLDELGEVAIRTKSGRELWLWFYSAGQGPAVLVCDPDGRDQFHGRGTDGEGRPVDGGRRLRKAVEDAFAEFQRMQPW